MNDFEACVLQFSQANLAFVGGDCNRGRYFPAQGSVVIRRKPQINVIKRRRHIGEGRLVKFEHRNHVGPLSHDS